MSYPESRRRTGAGRGRAGLEGSPRPQRPGLRPPRMRRSEALPSLGSESSLGRDEYALELLRVLQVRREGRPHIHQQLLELAVLGGRDQQVVQRIEHGLVVRNFPVNVGPIEMLAFQRLDGSPSLGRTLEERATDFVALGCDAELRSEGARLRVHGAVVGD